MEVVLSRRPDTGGAAARAAAPPAFLHAYVALVTLLGLACVAGVLARSPWVDVLDRVPLGPVLFLLVAALIGEARPLVIWRRDEPAETISLSLPFILALLAIGGLGIAVLVQVAVSTTDDVLSRRPLHKSLFNTGQYAVSVVAAGGTFALLSGDSVLAGPVPVDLRHIGPLLAAGLVMILVNRVLVATVVSLATRLPLGGILREEAWFNAGIQAVLLSIGGIAAYIAQAGTLPLVLLVAPVVATYLTSAGALRNAHDAAHDSLTNLGNRDKLMTRLRQSLHPHAPADAGPGLILLDLDHFKDINDTLGHPVGDELLTHVAERLTTALDDPNAAHRLGGDEFAVLVDGGLVRAQEVAERLLAALAAPMSISGLEVLVRASAGVAVAPGHGNDADTLLKHADIALYQAKLERDRITTYDHHLDVNSVDRLRLLADLGTAIENHGLAVAYQPQVDLATRSVVAVEALVRWDHPTRGDVSPDEFIPLAENSGLISHLTSYVLDTALGALADWRRRGHDVRMSVNLATRHLSDLALPRQVCSALERHGVPADRLVLEVTETGILSDPARVDVVIAALRELGVGIAVDDYGTGHASLSYLKRLAIDELKVDRSFVSDMRSDHHDFVIVRSTIGLATDLGLRVVAEGIEEEETADELHRMGCSIGQGYHLGRPTTEAEVLARLDADARSPVVPSQR